MKAVIFDMDGVLVDSEALINEASILMFHDLGHEVDSAAFTPFIGTGETQYIMGVAKMYGIPLDAESAKAKVYEHYLRLVPEKLKAFKGVKTLIRNCIKLNLKLALASSADRIKIDANLEKIGLLENTWDTIVSADDVKHKKPAPDIFLKAAKNLKLKPENCIVIEDSIEGIKAAHSANMKCIAVAHTFPKDLISDADFVFDKISMLDARFLVEH